ncbi:MAG: hypothetical protein IPN69_09055 [Acidobacteria bacterium]|nr:hypothetical protein [Acidobacteriota bacterium]
MSQISATIERLDDSPFQLRRMAFGVVLTLLLHVGLFAQATQVSTADGQETLIVEDAPDIEILAFGKNVIVKQHAKGVFAFGGNVIVEGIVDADVATIGGSVTQKEGARIGGDVIVLGGTFTAEGKQPLRNAERETVVIGVFEEEFRNFAQNPTAILSPSLSWSFVAQRILSVLFWFVITFAVTTISPGGIGRAVARFQLSSAKIIGLGIAGLILSSVGIVVSVGFLPGYLGGILGLMMLFLLFSAYVFGRVALQVSLGKFLQKQLIPVSSHSETMAILVGVVAWTAILSIPYIWTVALIVLFSASIGLVLTARSGNSWQNS